MTEGTYSQGVKDGHTLASAEYDLKVEALRNEWQGKLDTIEKAWSETLKEAEKKLAELTAKLDSAHVMLQDRVDVATGNFGIGCPN